MMPCEWDENKNRLNRHKHGLSFEEAQEIFEGPVLTWTDDRRDYGEIREISIGIIGETVVVVVAHTRRGERIRIISARRAKPVEREKYHAYLEKALGGNQGPAG